jgi:hypothetical protein
LIYCAGEFLVRTKALKLGRRFYNRAQLQPSRKSAENDGVLQAAEKLGFEVGRGFIPGLKAAESIRPLGPEVRFSPISPKSRPFSAASLTPEGYFYPSKHPLFDSSDRLTPVVAESEVQEAPRQLPQLVSPRPRHSAPGALQSKRSHSAPGSHVTASRETGP